MVIKLNLKKILQKNAAIVKVNKDKSQTKQLYRTHVGVHIVNVPNSLSSLKQILTVLTEITANKGNILIYNESTRKIRTNMSIINAWPNGYISNIKSTKNTKVPSFVVLLGQSDKKLKAITTELLLTSIPCAAIQSPYEHTDATYTATLNTKNDATNKLVLKAIQHAVINGYFKETLELKS
jgi:hypothetical protein